MANTDDKVGITITVTKLVFNQDTCSCEQSRFFFLSFRERENKIYAQQDFETQNVQETNGERTEELKEDFQK